MAKRKGRAPVAAHPTIHVYGTYRFIDKDPAIDLLRTVFQDKDLEFSKVSADSGVSVSTIHNWFEGGTKRPQFATLNAVARAVGYEFALKKLR